MGLLTKILVGGGAAAGSVAGVDNNLKHIADTQATALTQTNEIYTAATLSSGVEDSIHPATSQPAIDINAITDPEVEKTEARTAIREARDATSMTNFATRTGIGAAAGAAAGLMASTVIARRNRTRRPLTDIEDPDPVAVAANAAEVSIVDTNTALTEPSHITAMDKPKTTAVERLYYEPPEGYLSR